MTHDRIPLSRREECHLDFLCDIMSNMPVTDSYIPAFTAALAELHRMTEEREKLETQIARQKKRVAALAELARLDDEDPSATVLVDGITDACRTVLRGAERPLYPIEVSQRVEALGLAPQKNLLASVHTVLKRLVTSNQAAEVPPQSGSGPIAYRWAKSKSEQIAEIRSILEQRNAGDFRPSYGHPDPLNKRGK